MIWKHTVGLVWHIKVNEIQLCGPHISRDAIDSILNARRNASILRVGDITRDPQIGARGTLRLRGMVKRGYTCLPVSMVTE